MRGRAPLVECVFCGRRVPVDKATRFTKYSFSYYDERAGIRHRGVPETNHCCPSCARHRSIRNQRPMRGRPKLR